MRGGVFVRDRVSRGGIPPDSPEALAAIERVRLAIAEEFRPDRDLDPAWFKNRKRKQKADQEQSDEQLDECDE